MKRVIINLSCIFLMTFHSHSQQLVFEPEFISVPHKTTHEISFTEDGQTLYFTRTKDNKWGSSQLGFKSCLSNGKWGKPIKINFVDSLYNFSVSPEGNLVLYCKEDKTWMCTKDHEQWSEPIDLNLKYDYSYNGGYYHILNDQSFYFSGVQENAKHPYDDIYHVVKKEGHYQKPKRLNSNINTKATEFSPWVNRNNSVIIFTRYDSTSDQNTGVFISRFLGNKWQKAQKIDALDYGWGVFVREDTKVLYYTVNGNIQSYDLAKLDIELQ